MHTFRILHLSDLHLARTVNIVAFRDTLQKGVTRDLCLALWQSTCAPDVAERISRFVFRRAAELDLVIVTGDIATTGLNDDLREAVRFIDGEAGSVTGGAVEGPFPTLSGPGIRLRLLPGNHDRFQDFFCTPGGRAFDVAFEKYWRVSQGVQTQIVLSSLDGRDSLAVVSADCSLASTCDALPPGVGHFAKERFTSTSSKP